MCAITPHDTVRTMQYKNMLVSKRLIAKLIAAHQAGTVSVHRESRDFDSWYNKRTAADGKLDFHDRTRNLYNLIRGVTRPFQEHFASATAKRSRYGARIPLMRCWTSRCMHQGDYRHFDKADRTDAGRLSLVEDYESEKELGKE